MGLVALCLPPTDNKAAPRLNGSYLLLIKASRTERMQRLSYCERTQHEMKTSGMGSLPAFAALNPNVMSCRFSTFGSEMLGVWASFA